MNRSAIQAGALRALETVVWGAFVAGLQAAEPLLSTPSFAAVDWASVAHTFLAAALVAAMSGVGSYHAAVGAGAGSAEPAAPVPPAEPVAGQ